MSRVVISSKVVACTSQSSSIQWTPEHLWTSDRPQKQASAKADLLTFGSAVLVIS